MDEKRVCCLYRVSTKGQVDENDIPMQRQACRAFIESQGWTLVKELAELGISGFKISAKNRDAIQEIQHDAVKGEFDILLVFMFDRLGRKEDETPFIVEWFVKNGVEVWSVVEGQQKFENHVDKLMNYIRYWQASGESIKTSVRTKTRLGQIVQEGKFRGGIAPFGYKLVKRGRTGKKGKELYEIEVDEEEAFIVKKIFNLYSEKGFGGRKIASELKSMGIKNRKGEFFSYSTIQHMLPNIMYIGILRSGESRSEIFPELQIIDEDTFHRVQNMINQRSATFESYMQTPRKIVGEALLSGNIYCGHCGGRIHATTATQGHDKTIRVPIYKCYNRTKSSDFCDGATTYQARKIDNVIRQLLVNIFDKIKSINTKDIIKEQFSATLLDYEQQLKVLNTTYKKKEYEYKKFQGLIIEASDGKSAFTVEMVADGMRQTKEEMDLAKSNIESIQEKQADSKKLMDEITQKYNQLISWADMFQSADISSQKLIASYLIQKVSVMSYDEIDVSLNIDEEQFLEGMRM